MSDELIFAEEEAPQTGRQAAPWRVMIVDDEPEVHHVTRFALGEFKFEGRGLEFLHAYSGEEAKRLLRQESGVAMVLLDVVMESDDAGLKVARFIREELDETALRIILRTGQPGQAPEARVIIDYDINDYKTKTELTSQKLFTTLVTALRSWRDIQSLKRSREGLLKVIEASAALFEIRSFERFIGGILEQITSLLRLERDSIYLSAFVTSESIGELSILAGTGRWGEQARKPLQEAVEPEVMAVIKRAIAEGGSLFLPHATVVYFRSREGHDNIVYIEGREVDDPLDRQLLEIFCANSAIAVDNLMRYEALQRGQG
ncbi:MAG: DUF3369 domain-containing protein [Campylobacterales bacterium]